MRVLENPRGESRSVCCVLGKHCLGSRSRDGWMRIGGKPTGMGTIAGHVLHNVDKENRSAYSLKPAMAQPTPCSEGEQAER